MQDQIIYNCFDSHVHLLATGQVASGLNLSNLKSLSELSSIKKNPDYYRGDWLVGFGWDQHQWSLPNQWPTKNDLDEVFKTEPVYFSRVDGHTGWFNSIAQKKLIERGFDFKNPKYQSQISTDHSGPSGILLDQAHIDAMMLLPEFKDSQEKLFLKQAAQLFNRGGFTHIRDLSSSSKIWNQIDELQANHDFSLCVEGNITIENSYDLDRGVREYQETKAARNPYLRMKGLKVFVDGSLGSKTAALFENYLQESHNGSLFWSESEIAQVISKCWEINAEVSFHTIGDRAIDLVVRTARKVSASGLMGRINLEHVQLIKPETLMLMKSLHVTCHMQPCHWLSDQTWLKTTLSTTTYSQLFQWERLRKNRISLQFGSDSPIEPTSLLRNLRALQDSANQGIPALSDSALPFHAHPDQKWTTSKTMFNSEKIKLVVFDGRTVFES